MLSNGACNSDDGEVISKGACNSDDGEDVVPARLLKRSRSDTHDLSRNDGSAGPAKTCP